MRRSIHGVLILVSMSAAIPVVGLLVEHIEQPPMHPCTIEGEAARCGRIPVPENYGKPDGRRIALHAVVLGGANGGEGREPIFVLAGGPGQAATTLTQGASGMFRSVRRARDVVLIDQRGTGGANRLDCASAPRDQRCSQAFPNVVKDAEHFRTSVSDPFRLLGLLTLQYSANTAVLIPTLLKSAAAGDFSPLDSAVAGLREEYLHLPAAQLALGLHLTIVCGEDLPFGEPDTTSALRAEYARACRGWPAAPVATNYHEPMRLSTPALLMVGEWDPVTSPRLARLAADQFSPSHLVVFPKAGHALPAFGSCAGALVAGFLDGRAIDDSCTARIERPPYVVR